GGDAREREEPEAQLGVVVPGLRRRQRARGDENVQDPVGEPEGAPRPMHRRRNRITGPVGPHAGEELRQAAEHRGERSECETRLRRAPPTREIRRDDEGRSGKTEEAENRRRGDRLQKDAGRDAVGRELSRAVSSDVEFGLSAARIDRAPHASFIRCTLLIYGFPTCYLSLLLLWFSSCCVGKV